MRDMPVAEHHAVMPVIVAPAEIAMVDVEIRVPVQLAVLNAVPGGPQDAPHGGGAFPQLGRGRNQLAIAALRKGAADHLSVLVVAYVDCGGHNGPSAQTMNSMVVKPTAKANNQIAQNGSTTFFHIALFLALTWSRRGPHSSPAPCGR